MNYTYFSGFGLDIVDWNIFRDFGDASSLVLHIAGGPIGLILYQGMDIAFFPKFVNLIFKLWVLNLIGLSRKNV